MNLVPDFSKSQVQKINDAKDYEIIKQVHIDSIFRKDYLTSSSTDFLYEMPEPIKNVMIMRLITIEVPNTFYQFTEKNNSFRIVTHYAVPLEDGTINPSMETIITIPPGSYPAGDLMALIQTFFELNGDLQYLVIEVDDYNSKTTIRFKTGDELAIDFDIDTVESIMQNLQQYYTYDVFFDHQTPVCQDRPEYETVGWSFGYRKLFYKGVGYDTHVDQKFQKTFHGALISEGIFGANKMNYTFLCVNDFNRNSRESIITGNGNRTHINKDILSRVTIKFGSFFVNLDAGDNVFRERHYGGPVNIDKLQFKLIDKYGNNLNLNGSDWSAILEFICVR
tara:strand:+ start:2558 stop:3565 length:1008 start_codon:yes stop_codon:yes gene_type:complete